VLESWIGRGSLLVKTLIVTFEGQCEYVGQDGYSGIRLCSYSQDLIGAQAISGDSELCFLFNLLVPGWLPATNIFGDASEEEGGLRYMLHASMTFVDRSIPPWLNFLVSKPLSALCDIRIMRNTDTLASPV
jgi:hypothetical protein